jgi:hypothetical protein
MPRAASALTHRHALHLLLRRNSYVDTYNFLPLSGTKNYLGFNKTSIGNYFIYSDVSPLAVAQAAAAAAGRPVRELRSSPHGPPLGNGWNTCVMSYSTQVMPMNLTDLWMGNTCITASAKFFEISTCTPSAPLNGQLLRLSDNTWSSDAGNYSLRCGQTTWTLAQAQALGVDVGSKVVPSPSTSDIIAAGRALLQM